MVASSTRSVIVTGGGRGIGRAVALLAAERGWDVAVSWIADRGAAEEVVEAARGAGSRAIAVECDVAREPDVLRLFDAAARTPAPLGGLVNSAGGTGRSSRSRSRRRTSRTRPRPRPCAGRIFGA